MCLLPPPPLSCTMCTSPTPHVPHPLLMYIPIHPSCAPPTPHVHTHPPFMCPTPHIPNPVHYHCRLLERRGYSADQINQMITDKLDPQSLYEDPHDIYALLHTVHSQWVVGVATSSQTLYCKAFPLKETQLALWLQTLSHRSADVHIDGWGRVCRTSLCVCWFTAEPLCALWHTGRDMPSWFRKWASLGSNEDILPHWLDQWRSSLCFGMNHQAWTWYVCMYVCMYVIDSCVCATTRKGLWHFMRHMSFHSCSMKDWHTEMRKPGWTTPFRKCIVVLCSVPTADDCGCVCTAGGSNLESSCQPRSMEHSSYVQRYPLR